MAKRKLKRWLSWLKHRHMTDVIYWHFIQQHCNPVQRVQFDKITQVMNKTFNKKHHKNIKKYNKLKTKTMHQNTRQNKNKKTHQKAQTKKTE